MVEYSPDGHEIEEDGFYTAYPAVQVPASKEAGPGLNHAPRPPLRGSRRFTSSTQA